MKILFTLLFVLLFVPHAYSADYYSASRTDRDDKPAGMYTTTPFPIVEDDTDYSITNDEGTKTYNLGTVVYGDNTTISCSNGDTDYDPDNKTCGAGDKTVYTSIANALTGLGSGGNKTILLRAGTYSETGLTLYAGTDDLNRFNLIGYNQERPTIDAGGAGGCCIISAPAGTNSYVTIQRLKLQNSTKRGYFAGDFSGVDNEGYNNIIDVHFFELGMEAVGGQDGPLHLNRSHNNLVSHVTVERTNGHCMKIGDGTDTTIVEWSIVFECGWWNGITETTFWSHAMGIDFEGTGSLHGDNNIVRYNISYDTLFYTLQIRSQPNVSVHHNEFYNPQKCWDIMTDQELDCDDREFGQQTAIIKGGSYGETSGSIYSNIFRNPQTTDGPSDGDNKAHLNLITMNTNSPTLDVYNNIFYQHQDQAIGIGSGQTGATFNISNNSFHVNNSDTIIDNDAGTQTTLTNNIFSQAGSGSCVQGITGTHTYNQYNAPSGSVGLTTGGTELESDPQWVQVPSGTYDTNDAKLTTSSPGKDAGTSLSGTFTTDFLLVDRPKGPAWDMGMNEFIAPTTTNTILGITTIIGVGIQ